jgi:hypothetical protein
MPHSLKLSQKPNIVIPEMADVINAVAHEGTAVDAHTGCES